MKNRSREGAVLFFGSRFPSCALSCALGCCAALRGHCAESEGGSAVCALRGFARSFSLRKYAPTSTPTNSTIASRHHHSSTGTPSPAFALYHMFTTLSFAVP